MRQTTDKQDLQASLGAGFGAAMPAVRYPSATGLLIKAYWRKNKVNNLILLGTVSLIVFLSFSIFCLIPGKIHADMTNHICREGTCADAYVENGTKELSGWIKGLSFVEKIGFEKQIGMVEIAAENTVDTAFCEGVVLDGETFRTMIEPALVSLTGDYPEKKNEILLPLETLNQMGIDSPQPGMTILLHMDGQQQFVLSGYYEAAAETADAAGRMPRAFLSEAYLSYMEMELYPCRILIQTDGSFLNGKQMEILLSNELWQWMDAGQYIVANDSAAYVAISSTIGNYRIGVVFCIFLFLFLFFILYNLRAVSLSSDIRTFAGFQTIGVSRKEIRQIFNGQTWIIWLAGSAIGTVLGSVAALYLYPVVLRTLYLDPDQMISVFDPKRFLIILPLVGVMMAAASGMAMRRMEKISLREAQEYVDFTREESQKKERKLNHLCSASRHPMRKMGLELIFRELQPVSKKQDFPFGVKLQVLLAKRNRQNVVCHLARMGAFRSKKACFIRVCTLFLGWEMVLCAVVMSTGPDRKNELEQTPDFSITITQAAQQRMNEEEMLKWLERAGEFGEEHAEVVDVQGAAVSFDVEETEEPYVKKLLKNWERRERAAFYGEGNAYELPLYEIVCKSDEMAENEENMAGNRMLYEMICLFLLLAGLVNEISTTATDLTSRKRELFLLGQIGMTEKQIRKVLMLESLIYFGVSTGLLLTAGNLFLFLLQRYLKTRMEYFRFVYPLEAWMIVFLLLGVAAILIPQAVYRACNRKK